MSQFRPDEKRKVLVVDDRPREIAWLLGRLKDEYQCEVQHLHTEKGAKDHLKLMIQEDALLSYSLAIVDIMIPVATLEELVAIDEKFLRDSRDSGIRICRFIRQRLKIDASNLPIIALTARTDIDKLNKRLEGLDVQLFSRTDEALTEAIAKVLNTPMTP